MVGIIQNINLGGPQDFPLNYETVSEDFNATFDAAATRINASILLQAISNFKIIQSNNIFENGDLSFVEEFVDANGTNNTVNTGSSTSTFVTDHYEIMPIVGAVDTGLVTGAKNTHGTLNVFLTLLTGGFVSKVVLDHPSSYGNCTVNIIDSGANIIATKTLTITTSATAFDFTILDYTRIPANGEVLRVTTSIDVNLLTSQSYSGTNFTFSSETVPANYDGVSSTLQVTPVTVPSSTTLIHDTNTYTLDGTETGVLLWAKKTFTGDASITFDISDGVTTIVGAALDTFIDISTLNTGTLKITAVLAGTTGTPLYYGVSGVIIK
jgi:hypothetical protein